MKLTLNNIKKIKRESDSKLTKSVCDYVIDEWGNYNDKKAIFTEVLTHGCVSGCVGSLVYYSQTTVFFNKYKEEINELLYTLLDAYGGGISAIFGNRWDDSDPLAIYGQNQNLLAWFGFEETMRNIAGNFEDLEYFI